MPTRLLFFALMLCATSEAVGLDTTYTPSQTLPEGEEVVAIYVGSSKCGPCQGARLKAAIEEMKTTLAERAKAIDQDFSVTGIAMEYDVEAGIRFLQETGQFDELIVGRNWMNTGALRYIWSEVSEGIGVPQVIVVRRNVDLKKRGVEVSRPTLLATHVGSEKIVDWVEAGAPLSRQR